MLQTILGLLRRLYTLFWMLVLTGLLSVFAVLTWHFYQEEHLQSQLKEHGKPVTVRVERADRKARALWDGLGNFVYLGFTHEQRPYEVRYVADTSWLSEGDRVTLLYDPQRQVFGQPSRTRASTETRVVSRLIDWTVAQSFTAETKALGLFIMVALALFFIGSGLLVFLTGLTIVQAAARAMLVMALGAAALFFTYDALQYYRYVDQLKRTGTPMVVQVFDTDRTVHGRRSGSQWYTYDATFRFNNQERVVAIEEADFDRLTPKDPRLTVRYAAAQNDFIAEGYSASIFQVVMPLFFWLLFVLTFRSTGSRRTAVQPAQMG